MPQTMSAVTLLVPDYDAAIAYYVDVLGLELVADTALGLAKRWVLVRPRGQLATCLLLAKADTEAQRAAIGNQAGGRVAFFLSTTDFAGDFARYTSRGVKFREQPRHESYGTVAVFEDAFGNLWDLIQPAA